MNWTQEQLDSFISKNDWGQVAKYIAESRKTTNGDASQAKVGRMTKMQEVVPPDDDDDSVWQSLDDGGNENGKDESFDYDKVAARQTVSAVQ